MTMSPRFRAALAFVATFAAGAASMRAVEAISLYAKPAPREWSDAANKLALTPEQRLRIDSVFARYQPSTDAVLASLAPRLAIISDSIQVEMDSILTADQRQQLKAMQSGPKYMIRRKTIGGSRVDTLRVPPPPG